MEFDIFISHASEDKDEIARPLAERLRQHGLRVWIDETEIKLGDSLRRSIDRGLSKSKYGLVVLSPHFLSKEWPQKELDGLVAREDGTEKVILPVWHNVSRADVVKFSPPLADKLAVPTSKGLSHIVAQVLKVFELTDTAPPSRQADQQGGQSQDIEDLLVKVLDKVMALSGDGPTFVTGIPTGLADLDLMTAGLQSGTLVLAAGGVDSGKTAFAISVVAHVACHEGLPVLLFSPNEIAEKTTNRILGVLSRIPASRLRVAGLNDEEWPAYVKAVEKLRTAPLALHDSNDLTIDDIQRESRRRLNMHGTLGLVVIDSLQHIEPQNGGDSDPAGICRKLKALAREIRCPVLLISDLSRTSLTRMDKRPILSDLGDVDRFADAVFMLYRHSNYDLRYTVSPDVVELIVAKQKDGGPKGTVRLHFDARCGSLGNISEPDSSVASVPHVPTDY
nr:DnaB-like helicase C-terminal domain-containing protein [uncultured Albidiferax sp.]